MKKIFFTLVAVLCCWMTLFAQQLTEQQAMERALQYMNSGKSSSNARRMAAPALKGSKKLTPATTEATKIYAFNMDGGGYVIASADQRTLPVLGYSTTGSIDWEQMPENMRSWLKQYDEAIATLGYRRDFRQARIDCNRHNSSPTLRRITQRKTGNRFALHEAIEHHGLEPVCRHLQRIVEGLALGTIASSRPEGPAEKPAALLNELEFADIHLYLRPASRLIAAAS